MVNSSTAANTKSIQRYLELCSNIHTESGKSLPREFSIIDARGSRMAKETLRLTIFLNIMADFGSAKNARVMEEVKNQFALANAQQLLQVSRIDIVR